MGASSCLCWSPSPRLCARVDLGETGLQIVPTRMSMASLLRQSYPRPSKLDDRSRLAGDPGLVLATQAFRKLLGLHCCRLPVSMFLELIGGFDALTSSSRCHDGKFLTVLRSPWPSSRVLLGTRFVVKLIATQPPGPLLLVLNGLRQFFTIDLVPIHLALGVIHSGQVLHLRPSKPRSGIARRFGWDSKVDVLNYLAQISMLWDARRG